MGAIGTFWLQRCGNCITFEVFAFNTKLPEMSMLPCACKSETFRSLYTDALLILGESKKLSGA